MKILKLKPILVVLYSVFALFSNNVFADASMETAIVVQGDSVRAATPRATCYSKDIILHDKTVMMKLNSLSNGVYVCTGNFSSSLAEYSSSMTMIYSLVSCRKASDEEAQSNCAPGH